MKKTIMTILVLLLGSAFSQEFEVNGDLRLQGNIIFSDSTVQNMAATPTPGINGVAEFTSSTTWNVPSDITKVRIILIGAGGGGACNYGVSGCTSGGGGGGAGGYVQAVVNVTSGESLTFTIGNGGSGGAYGYNPGGNGEDSSVATQYGITLITAYGGSGGTGGNGGAGGTGSISDGIGFIRNGGGGPGATAGGAGGGSVNALASAFGHGNGGNGGGCPNNITGGSGGSGYLLMYW